MIKTTEQVGDQLQEFSAGWLQAIQVAAKDEYKALGSDFDMAHEYSLFDHSCQSTSVGMPSCRATPLA